MNEKQDEILTNQPQGLSLTLSQKTLLWGFSILVFVGGIGGLFSSLVAGILLIIASTFFNPYLIQKISKNDKNLKLSRFVAAGFIFLFASSYFITSPQPAEHKPLSFSTSKPQPLWAKFIKRRAPACLTEDLFDHFVSAAIKKDQRGLNYLLKNGCIYLAEGTEFSVLDSGWTVAKIRVYLPDNTAVELWTNIENVRY